MQITSDHICLFPVAQQVVGVCSLFIHGIEALLIKINLVANKALHSNNQDLHAQLKSTALDRSKAYTQFCQANLETYTRISAKVPEMPNAEELIAVILDSGIHLDLKSIESMQGFKEYSQACYWYETTKQFTPSDAEYLDTINKISYLTRELEGEKAKILIDIQRIIPIWGTIFSWRNLCNQQFELDDSALHV